MQPPNRRTKIFKKSTKKKIPREEKEKERKKTRKIKPGNAAGSSCLNYEVKVVQVFYIILFSVLFFFSFCRQLENSIGNS